MAPIVATHQVGAIAESTQTPKPFRPVLRELLVTGLMQRLIAGPFGPL
jgi:hypothetical protein